MSFAALDPFWVLCSLLLSAELGGIGGKLGRMRLAAFERRACRLATWSFAAQALAELEAAA